MRKIEKNEDRLYEATAATSMAPGKYEILPWTFFRSDKSLR